MNVKEGFIGGFLILGFAVFIVGFLTGMLAIMMIPAKPDVAALGFMVFIYGFITGIVATTLLFIAVKSIRSSRKSSQIKSK